MTLKTDIDQLAVDAGLLHDIIHGGTSDTVSTDGGTVPSVAKAINDAVNVIESGQVADGSAAAPSIAFANDTDSGIYRIGANNIGVAVNGAKVVDIGTGGVAVTGTLSATGAISSTLTSGPVLADVSGGTNSLYIQLGNTGGNSFFGVDNSTGIALATGTAYAFGIYTPTEISGVVAGAKVTATTSTGLAVTGLLDISAASSGQIKFPATQNASSNANTLDDYEEGTWTPTDTSGAGLSLTLTACRYTKVGRLVTVSGAVGYPATANGSNAKISLPFTPGAQKAVGACTGSAANLASYVTTGDANMYFLAIAGGAVQTNASLSGATLIVSCTYTV